MIRQKSALTSTCLKGWTASMAEDGRYLYVERTGKAGKVHIKADCEGFVVDLWNHDEREVVAAATAVYQELEFDEEFGSAAAEQLDCRGIDVRGATSSILGDWTITTSQQGDCLSIDYRARPGQIHLWDGEEGMDGLVARLWNHDEQLVIASARASYDELGV